MQKPLITSNDFREVAKAYNEKQTAIIDGVYPNYHERILGIYEDIEAAAKEGESYIYTTLENYEKDVLKGRGFEVFPYSDVSENFYKISW